MTIAELAPEGKLKLDSASQSSNTVRAHADWLAPKIITLLESASVWLPDEKGFSGVLTVDYYETISPLLARELAREHQAEDRRVKDYRELSLPELGVDYAAGYVSSNVTLIAVEGKKIMHLTFTPTSPAFGIKREDWMRIFARSIT